MSSVSTFHRSSTIATPLPPPSSVTLASSIPLLTSLSSNVTTGAIISNPSEASWWATNYGLSGSGTSSKNFHKTKATRVILQTPNANSIHAIEFAPVPPYTMAVASGPRVLLYDPSGNSSLYRAMNRKGTKSALDDDDNDDEEQAKKSGKRFATVTVPPDKTIPFPGPVYATSFRPDGRLLAIGGHDGTIRVVDIQTKSIMRSFRAQGNVRCIKWLRDGKHLLTSGDDAVVRLWDVSQPSRTEPVVLWVGHGDSVRAMVVVYLKEKYSASKKRKHSQEPEKTDVTGKSVGGRYVLVTGSYDHSVRVWDLNGSLALLPQPTKQGSWGPEKHDEKAINASHMLLATIHHGAPVETLVQSTNSKEVLSAGGTSIKLWNIVTNTLLRENDTSHSKTITSLSLVNMVGSASVGNSTLGEQESSNQQPQMRLLSTGLDGFLRIYDPATFHCLHGSKVASPLLSAAMSPFVSSATSNRLLVTGSTDGFLHIRQRPRPVTQTARKREPRAGTYSYFMRGASTLPAADDYTVELQRHQRLQPFDKALRQFRYGEALDEALSTKAPQVVSAVLEELSKRRSGLEIALSNRDEETLEPILAFCARHIVQPRFAPLLTGVVHVLLDIYEDVLGQSAMIDELMERLRRMVSEEVRAQQVLLRLLGQLDGVITVAEMKRVQEQT